MLDPLSVHIPTAAHVSHRPVLPRRKLLRRIPGTYDFEMEIDNSARDLFTRCPREAENYLIHGRTSSANGSATGFGGLFHKLAEQRILLGWEEALPIQHRLIDDYFSLNPPHPEDHRTAARMRQVLELYREKWQYDFWQSRVLRDSNNTPFVERSFRIPLITLSVNTFLSYNADQLVIDEDDRSPLRVDHIHIFWTGRIDLMLDEHPYLLNVDYKTTKMGGESFWNDFKNSGQTVGYTWAATKILQRKVHGTLIDAVTIREPLKTETKRSLPRNEFDRRTFFYDDWMLAEWERNAINTVQDMTHCLVRAYWPQTPKSFKSPCEYCQYQKNCLLPPEQRGPELATDLYVNVTWNPLDGD